MMRNARQTVCAMIALAMCILAACGTSPSPESGSQAPMDEMTAETLQGDQTKTQEDAGENVGIGEVYFLPYQYEALMGTNTLSVFARKSGLQAGDGVLTVHRADDSILEEIRFDNLEQVELGPLSEGDRDFAKWDEEGTKATVVLNHPLTEPGEYYVTLTENCLMDPASGTGSRALEKGTWSFGIAQYGISQISLFGKDTCQVGETVTMSIRLGGGAVKAVLTGFDPEMVEPVTEELTADGELAFVCKKAGPAQWSVVLLNEAGEIIDGTTIAVSVE